MIISENQTTEWTPQDETPKTLKLTFLSKETFWVIKITNYHDNIWRCQPEGFCGMLLQKGS